MASRETLDLLLKLDVQGDAQLKGMADNADKAAQRLQELAQKTDLTTRTMATQQKELAGLQQQYAATAGRATELADKLDKVVAAEGKNSAAATKLQSELDRTATAAQKVAIAIEKKEIALQRGSNALQKIASEAAQTGTALQSEAAAATKSAQAHLQLSRDSDGAGNAFTGMATRLTGLAAGFLGLQGAIQAIQWGKQGASIADVQASFEKLAVSAGTTGDVLLASMQKASKGTIANSDLMAKANAANILTQGRLVSELPKLLEIAGASAKAMGTNVNEAFDSIVLGLSRNSKMIIDNLGITVDIEAANRRYAESLGITVQELTDQQKAQAFTNEVLLQGDKLVQTIGTSTLTTAEKISQAEANIKNFTDGLKIMAGEAVGFLAGGINAIPVILGGVGAAVDSLTAQAITAGHSWNEYKAAFDAVGEGGEAFTQQAWAAVLALEEQGVATQDAVTQVAALKDTEGELAAALVNVGLQTGMTTEAQADLIAKALELAAASPAAAEGVAVLIEQLDGGRGSLDDFTAGLEVIAINQEYATSTSFGYADAQLSAADASDVATDSAYTAADSVFYLSEEQAENANVSAEAELAALNLADAHAMMEQVVANVQSGLYSESDALAILQAQFHLSEDAALRFLNVQLALNAALGKQTSIANMGKLVNVGGKAYEKQVAEQQRSAERAGAQARREADRAANRANRPARSSGGGSGRSAGGSSKKPKESEAVKQAKKEADELDKIQDKVEKAKTDYQRKVEDAAKKHADKLQAIDEAYFQKNLEATNKFNADKFDTQLGFLESIAKVDQDFWDQARAAEDAYWQESQAMAQAGHAEQAAALYEAGQEEVRIKAENAQEMRDLRTQIAEEEDAAERAKLEQQLARQAEINAREEQLAADKVKKIREGGDQLEQERADAIAKENEDYSEAQDTLKADFQETLADIKTSYADMGAAARELADGIIAAAEAATTAVNAIPMPSASGAPADAAPVGSYATGTGSRGLPRTGMFEGHAGEIILNRKQSDVLRQVGGTQAVDRMDRIAQPLAGARTPGVNTAGSASTSTTSSAVTIAPGAVVIQAGNANPSQIADLVEQRLRKFTRDTGGAAASRQKMGGR